MFTVLVILSLVAAVVVAVILVVSHRAGSEPRGDLDVTPAASSDFPRPGEPTRRRPDGSIPPGSRDDRDRHGKP